MAGTTVPLGFPYPTAGDPLLGPAQIQALAEAVDDAVAALIVSANAAAAPPAAKVTGTTQPIQTALGTIVQFNSVYFDNDGMADLVAEPTALTVQTAGVYLVSGSGAFVPNATGFRQFDLFKNGVTTIAQWRTPALNSAGVGLSQNVTGLVSMAVGDKFSFAAGHTAGITISVFDLQMMAVRVSP